MDNKKLSVEFAFKFSYLLLIYCEVDIKASLGSSTVGESGEVIY